MPALSEVEGFDQFICCGQQFGQTGQPLWSEIVIIDGD